MLSWSGVAFRFSPLQTVPLLVSAGCVFDVHLLTLDSELALQHGRISPPPCPEDNGLCSGLFNASLSPLCRNIGCRSEAHPAGAAKEGPLCCVARVRRLLSSARRPRGGPFSARSWQTELPEAQTTGTVSRAAGLACRGGGGHPSGCFSLEVSYQPKPQPFSSVLPPPHRGC